MYLWNTKALITDLRNNQVTQKEQLKYSLIGPVFWSIIPHEVNLCSILEITLVLIGFFSCYKSNSEGDNKDFILRMTCLSLPVSIRLLLPTMFGIALELFTRKFNLTEGLLSSIFLYFIMGPIYFYILRSSIIQVSQVHEK